MFVAKDGLSVIKLNNFGLLPKAATSLAGFVHRLISHNKLFPEDAYTIIGFALNSGNEPCVVLRQPYIKAERYATDEEIDEFLEAHGYTVDMDDIWFNRTYEISDVKPTNVLLDQKGKKVTLSKMITRYAKNSIKKVMKILKQERKMTNMVSTKTTKKIYEKEKFHSNINSFVSM